MKDPWVSNSTLICEGKCRFNHKAELLCEKHLEYLKLSMKKQENK